jgi:sulfate adenylyltransferase subunit 1
MSPSAEGRPSWSGSKGARRPGPTVGAGMIISSVEGFAKLEENKKIYSQAEIELNEFIRRNYPEWNCKAI